MSSSIGRVGTVYLIITCLIEWTCYEDRSNGLGFWANRDLNINAIFDPLC